MEALESIDRYNQRADVCQNPQLKAILVHNCDEFEPLGRPVIASGRQRRALSAYSPQ